MSISLVSQYPLLNEWKRFTQWGGGCLKILKLLLKKIIINYHPTTSPNTSLNLQYPDPNKTSTTKTVPYNIKDSAINVCTLNIRSLTIKEDSIKLKRLFKLDSAIIVLTEVCMNGSDYNKLCQYWREQISRYQVWTTGTDYLTLKPNNILEN